MWSRQFRQSRRAMACAMAPADEVPAPLTRLPAVPRSGRAASAPGEDGLSETGSSARLGVDIGGTFTDVALEAGGRRWTAKILTTSAAPERGVLEAMQAVLAAASIAPAQVALVIHGTTLATNALIERKGAKTALLTTEGFRDTIEIRHENRFEQYDVNIDLPPPLVPRRLRFPVHERVDAGGRVLVPLDEAALLPLADRLAAERIESIAIGFLHSFTNPAHERRAGE